MDVLAFVNLSQLKTQYFSFPKPLIHYIFDNSQLISSQKLIKSCKIFKLLHLKKNESRLEKVIITFSSCKISAGLSKFYLANKNYDRCCCNFNTVMNSIKILHTLHLCLGLKDIYLKTLPKLDLSQTKEIYVNTDSYLKREILEIITPISLEKFSVGCGSGAEINPALFVFQKCPKLKRIGISYIYSFNSDIVVLILTKNILKEILLIKREKIFTFIDFRYASEVDRDDFMNFMNNHLAFNGKMLLVFRTREIFDAFVRMLDEIQEIRQKESKISEKKIYYRLSHSFYWNEKIF